MSRNAFKLKESTSIECVCRSLNLDGNQSAATDVSIFNKDKSLIFSDIDSALSALSALYYKPDDGVRVVGA